MTVREASKQLGEVLAAKEEVRVFNAAKAAYDADGELQALLGEYRAQRTLLGEMYAKPLTEEEAATAEKINERVMEIGEAVRTHPVYTALSEAQEAVNSLMAAVNADLSFFAFGEAPDCTHNCSGCSGCGGGCSQAGE